MASFLDRLLRRKPRAAHDVVVYKTRTCKLCEEALHVLADVRAKRPFALEVVDVTDVPELFARFGQEVPVVFVDGEKRFFGRVDPVLFRRLIER